MKNFWPTYKQFARMTLVPCVCAFLQPGVFYGQRPDVVTTRQLPPDAPVPGPVVAGQTFAAVNLRNGEPVLNAPYQAQSESESVQHLADGNVIQNSHSSKVARDAQGRTWTEENIQRMGPWSTGSGSQTVVFISDPVAGASYVLHPDTKTAEKMPLPKSNGHPSKNQMFYVQKGSFEAGSAAPATTMAMPALSVAFASADPSMAKTEDLGTQQMNGLLAQGKRITDTIPADTVGNQLPIVTTTETWYSPDLHLVIESKRDDPRLGESTFALKNIQKSDPPAELFQIPSDYTVTDGPKVLEFRKQP